MLLSPSCTNGIQDNQSDPKLDIVAVVLSLGTKKKYNNKEKLYRMT